MVGDDRTCEGYVNAISLVALPQERNEFFVSLLNSTSWKPSWVCRLTSTNSRVAQNNVTSHSRPALRIFCVVRAASEKFGLHAGNNKFKTPNEE